MPKPRERLQADMEEMAESTGEAPLLSMSAAAVAAAAAAAEVGRMVDSSQADDRKMIRLVKARRLLYARNNMPVASYYTTVKRLWQEVAEEMGCTVADVRRKWSHIRNSYSRHLRNEMHGARTGKGRMVSKWYLADELQFLREHMATDTRTSPYSSFTPTSFLSISEQPAGAGAGVAAAESVDIKPFMHSPWFSLGAHAQAFEPPPLDDTSSSHTFEPDENSAYFHFFRGIYNDYQELPMRKQRLFRRQCLNFLHNLLDEEDGHNGMDEQSDAINLTNSVEARSDEEDQKIGVLDKVHEFRILPDE